MPPFSANITPAAAIAERARVLLDIGRPQEALPLLAQAAASESGSARIHCLMALAYLNVEDYKACVLASEEAIRAAPDKECGHRLRANGLLRLGRSRQALQAAQEAVRCGSQEKQAWHTLVLAQIAVGRIRDADATAHTLRALWPEAAGTHEAMGLVALRQQRWREAEEEFRSALRINPLSHIALNNLGVALRRRGRLPEAIDCFYRASKVMPTDKKAAENSDEAVWAYLVNPISCSLGIAMGVEVSYISGMSANIGILSWLGMIGAMIVTFILLVLYSRRRWQALPPDTRNVIRQRARNFLRFFTRS